MMSFDYNVNCVELTPYSRPALLSEAEKTEACEQLLRFLMRERGLIAAFHASYEKKHNVVRACMNERMPIPVPREILDVQDRLFWTNSVERGIVDATQFAEIKPQIALWEGDITRLNCDAIVNAANKTLLGCFIAGHNCIDNVIHSAAGMQLRADCKRVTAELGHDDEAGNARITRAYNLPSKYVIHTVGPMINGEVSEMQRAQLRSCYLASLDLAMGIKLRSIAFCCISTGVFNFPCDEAAEIATGAVMSWKYRHPDYDIKVIFNTYTKRDTAIYRSILSML